MQNITMKTTGDKLVIEIDLSKNLGTSKSGKSSIIATTSGNIEIENKPGIKIGINCYSPVK